MEGLLSALLKADVGERAIGSTRVSLALSAHLALEEEDFYPAVRARRTEDVLVESLETSPSSV